MASEQPKKPKTFPECVQEKIKEGHPIKQATAHAYTEYRAGQKKPKKKG